MNNEGIGLEGTNELISTINLNYSDTAETKSKLNFLSNGSSQFICVAIHNSKSNSDILQIWQVSSVKLDAKEITWNLVKTIKCPSTVVNIRIPEISFNFKEIYENQSEKSFFTVSYENGQTSFIDTQNFNQVLISPIPINKENHHPQQSTIISKKIRYVQDYLVAFDLSHTGAIGAGITNNRKIITFRNPEIKNILIQNNNAQFSLSYLVNLFEYCFLSGADFWDLIVSTNPKLIDTLIRTLEHRFISQSQSSIQKAYFFKFYSLVYSLRRRSLKRSQFSSLDILVKQILNRSMSIISFAVQLTLNMDSLVTTFSSSSSSSYINTTTIPPSINTALIVSSSDFINSQIVSNAQSNPFSHIPLKSSLNDYFTEILKLDQNPNEFKLNINEIVQSVLNKKNLTIIVNQQLRHVNQWIVEMALSVANAGANVYKPNQLKQEQYEVFAASLLNDSFFLNELRRGLIIIKLLFVYSSMLASPQSSMQQLPNNFVSSSLPVLTLRSSIYQKDFVSDLFNLITKLIHKNFESKILQIHDL